MYISLSLCYGSLQRVITSGFTYELHSECNTEVFHPSYYPIKKVMIVSSSMKIFIKKLIIKTELLVIISSNTGIRPCK
jgi:hypothetical protein